MGEDEKTEDTEANTAGSRTVPEQSPAETPAEPPTEKTLGKLLKRTELPTPELLRPEAKELPEVPSVVPLERISLPPHMKGPVAREAERKKEKISAVSPELARSIREVGLKPREPAHDATDETAQEKKIVSVAAEKRTEIGEDGLPRIRTYAGDVSEAVKRKGATLSTIVGAERERVAAMKSLPQEDPTKARWRPVLLAGAGFLLLAGIGMIIGASFLLPKSGSMLTVEASIIPENKTVRVDAGSAALPELLAGERERAELSLGEIERIMVTDSGAELSPKTLLAGLGAPGQLARNARRVMVGIHAFDKNQPLIIIETAYYDLSFEAMLSWEEKMAESLGPFFAPDGATGPPPALHFVDAVFKNTDVRESESGWPMVYAFLANRHLLVITTNENTLAEILTRLSLVQSGF